jgi:hypothetical protein
VRMSMQSGGCTSCASSPVGRKPKTQHQQSACRSARRTRHARGCQQRVREAR